MAQSHSPSSMSPSNENVPCGPQLTKTFPPPAGQGGCAYGLIVQTTASNKEVTTADGVLSSGHPSPKLFSPDKQPAWVEDVERRPQVRRKQSAAEMFPRTDHRDKEECWDESCFWGIQEDEWVLKEMGEAAVTTITEKELGAPVSRVCRDPCWR